MMFWYRRAFLSSSSRSKHGPGGRSGLPYLRRVKKMVRTRAQDRQRPIQDHVAHVEGRGVWQAVGQVKEHSLRRRQYVVETLPQRGANRRHQQNKDHLEPVVPLLQLKLTLGLGGKGEGAADDGAQGTWEKSHEQGQQKSRKDTFEQ